MYDLQVEDDLLSTLAKSEGDILENKELLQSLKDSKKSSKEIKSTLAEISETKSSLELERGKFALLAQSAATSYFRIQDFAGLNVMYTTGLHVILELYNFTLRKYHNGGVDKLNKNFIALIVQFVQNLSSTEHEVANCLHLINGLFSSKFRENEWDLLLQGDRADIKSKFSKNESEISEWLSKDHPETSSPRSLTPFQLGIAFFGNHKW